MLTNDSSKNIEDGADYAHGRRDGLRLALAVLASEEAKWAALLGESASWRTNVTREVRHKTLQVAQNRLKTALNRITPKGSSAAKIEIVAALEELGLAPSNQMHRLCHTAE